MASTRRRLILVQSDSVRSEELQSSLHRPLQVQAAPYSSSSFEEQQQHHHHHHPSGCDNNNNNNNKDGDGDNLLRSSTTIPWYLCEAQAVSLWACASLTTSILIRSLVVGESWIDLATADDDSDNNGIVNESTVTTIIAIRASARLLCHLLLLPAKGIHGQSPAFFFSNAVILLWVRHRTGVTPHLPTRCSEYMMGRIGSLRMLVGVCLIHLGLCHAIAFVLQQVVAASASAGPVQQAHRVAVEGEDGNDNHPWIVDLCRQVFVTAAFVVSLLVVPVLLRLNKVPTWTMLFLFYPIYQYSVNNAGVGDSLSPNALLSIETLDGRPVPTIICRILGPVIGGLVGGLVMNRYFPDEDAGKYVKSTYR